MFDTEGRKAPICADMPAEFPQTDNGNLFPRFLVSAGMLVLTRRELCFPMSRIVHAVDRGARAYLKPGSKRC